MTVSVNCLYYDNKIKLKTAIPLFQYFAILLLSVVGLHQTSAGCLTCWKQLHRCVRVEQCLENERIRPTVEVLNALILRDCPIENEGPCPLIGCDQCPECPVLQCQPCVTPSTTTASTTTTSTTVTTPCPHCECTHSDLKACQDSLSFIDLTKEGAQGSRTSWKEEVERLNPLLDRERNTTKTYKEKWSEMSTLYATCINGYSEANNSIEFSLNLVNEFSGKLNNCNESLIVELNNTVRLEKDLLVCVNSTVSLLDELEDRRSNLTVLDRKLFSCRTQVSALNNTLLKCENKSKGNPFYCIDNFLYLIQSKLGS